MRSHVGDPGPSQSIVLDGRLGWKAAPGWTRHDDGHDASGRAYPIDIEVGADGCRRAAPDRDRREPRVLFVGDSFTEAVDVSDTTAYWARFAALRHVDARACGAGGYGTLQELMVLEEALHRVHPATVVLQFSSNDFVNNSYELERRSLTNNNGMRRPYLENGAVAYRSPVSLAPLRAFSDRHLRSFAFLFTGFDRLGARWGRSVESDVVRDGPSEPLFAAAARTTGVLLARIRDLVGPRRRLFAFIVDDVPPFNVEFGRLACANGFTVLPGIAAAVRAAQAAGVQTSAGDGAHWDDAGHRIAADVLSRTIPD